MKLLGMGLQAIVYPRKVFLKYLPPLLPLEGPEICLHDRSIPIEILTKQHFTLIFSYHLLFSLPLVPKINFLLFE